MYLRNAMLTQILWWGGTLLLCLLLLRGVQAKWLFRFPLFYAYSSFVLLETLSLFVSYRIAPHHYAQLYWTCRFVALALGSMVLFEIYRIALQAYPGTARVARNLLFFVFALAFAKVLVNYSNGSLWWPAKTYQELERNLRAVQAFALVALIVVIVAYAIPRDRHLKGILAGYGLFVASSVVDLSLLSKLGSSFQGVHVYIQQLSYDLVLCLWIFALWSPVAEPSHSPSPLELAANHPALVTHARRKLEEIQLGLPGGARR